MKSSLGRASILLLAHSRHEHLRSTVRALTQARNFSNHNTLAFIDGDWPKTIEVLKESLSPNFLVESRSDEKLEPRNRIRQNIDLGLRISFDQLQSPYTIVIEDDIVIAPDFLDFVEAIMEKHARDAGFRAVNGFSLLSDSDGAEPCHYTRVNYGVGHGWALPRKTYQRIRNLLSRQGDFHFDSLIEPHIRTGYVVHPLRSRTVNIGFDGTGTHASSSKLEGITEAMRKSFLSDSTWHSTKLNLEERKIAFPWRNDAVSLSRISPLDRFKVYLSGWLLQLISATARKLEGQRESRIHRILNAWRKTLIKVILPKYAHHSWGGVRFRLLYPHD